VVMVMAIDKREDSLAYRSAMARLAPRPAAPDAAGPFANSLTARFMDRMLNLREMQDRLGALLAHEEKVLKRGIRMEALRPLHYLFVTQGEIGRGEFASMTGLGERTATTL